LLWPKLLTNFGVRSISPPSALRSLFPQLKSSLIHTDVKVGLHTIGLIIFLLNLCLFLVFSAIMTARICLYPHHVKRALSHPSESLFLGSFLLSMSVIIGGIQVYSITYGPSYPWLISTIYILYWLYSGLSFTNCVFQYWILITRSIVRPVPFTPSMFLAGYSAMLTGTIASLIAPTQPPSHSLLVIYSGVAFQGYGFLISLVCIAFFIRGLLDTGFPPPALRPALFIPVGSIAYTILALINLSNAIPPDTGYFGTHPTAKEILQVLALFVSIFMWLFAFWLFSLALLANIGAAVKGMEFKLSWWAFIFPNVGFMLGTSVMGRELESEAILWIASVMTVGLVGIWVVAAVGCVRAVWRGQIVWPGRDEDKDL
jgi:C4-dicarboxylate transporter/malic acid transport protein